MPNWVKNIVKTDKDVIADIKSKYFNEEGLDFNKIIPMPKDLDITSGGSGEDGLMILFFESNNDEEKKQINQVYRSLNCFHDDIYLHPRFLRLLKDYGKIKEDSLYKSLKEMGTKYLENYKKYGYANWYNWCCDKWGTKWNSSGCRSNEEMIIFETAWEFPGRVISKLSEKYPDAIFKCRFADEGIKENSGIVDFKNGQVISGKYNLPLKNINTIWATYLDGQEQKIDEEELELEK